MSEPPAPSPVVDLLYTPGDTPAPGQCCVVDLPGTGYALRPSPPPGEGSCACGPLGPDRPLGGDHPDRVSLERLGSGRYRVRNAHGEVLGDLCGVPEPAPWGDAGAYVPTFAGGRPTDPAEHGARPGAVVEGFSPATPRAALWTDAAVAMPEEDLARGGCMVVALDARTGRGLAMTAATARALARDLLAAADRADGRPAADVDAIVLDAFAAYNAETGGLTHDNKPIPPFERIRETNPKVARAWRAAVNAVLDRAAR